MGVTSIILHIRHDIVKGGTSYSSHQILLSIRSTLTGPVHTQKWGNDAGCGLTAGPLGVCLSGTQVKKLNIAHQPRSLTYPPPSPLRGKTSAKLELAHENQMLNFREF